MSFITLTPTSMPHVGPLIWVNNPASSAKTTSYENRASPLEVQALDNEVKRLLAYVDVLVRHHENAIIDVERRAQSSEEALKRSHADLMEQHQNKSERLRTQMQVEMDGLRQRLGKLEEFESRMDSVVEENKELRRKLAEQERSWTSVTTSKDNQSKLRLEEAENEKKSMSDRIDYLLSVVEALEGTLRTTLQEKEGLEDFINREPQRWQAAAAMSDRQLEVQSSDLDALRKRNATLESLLDELQREHAIREESVDERITLLKHELELEKKRASEIVAMYSDQIEHLHKQLDVSMTKNKLLLGELQKEKGKGSSTQ